MNERCKKAANEPTKTKQPASQPTIQSANDDDKVFRIGKQSVSLASTTANEKRMCVAIAFPSFQENAANEENGSYGIIKWTHVTEKNVFAWGYEGWLKKHGKAKEKKRFNVEKREKPVRLILNFCSKFPLKFER